ncbi:hypothetical protein CWATWH8502_2786 [Crocosphaera watsonii WH 8502]|uniref:Uncharacterized protein n=2 Tax=Crocosphaera watsonii TaxID=263511 RepID=T2JH48_CROWT|nr:hypothetical protein CWATWH8502_2786 [Crocosphaera watsonii WH 8502]CCQ64374.1 hypothetical protein CWATWH0401_3305 [Crocosphaera watsonii WH 0401]
MTLIYHKPPVETTGEQGAYFSRDLFRLSGDRKIPILQG